MKHILLLFFAVVLLTSCEVVVTLHPNVLQIHAASYSSNFRDSSGRSYICDDRQTTLTYRFDYHGDLHSWRSYLQGQYTQEIRGDISFSAHHPAVTAYSQDHAEVSYVIAPYVAPLSQTPSSEGIVVIPDPVVIGHSKLKLELYSHAGHVERYSSAPIPVVSGC